MRGYTGGVFLCEGVHRMGIICEGVNRRGIYQ